MNTKIITKALNTWLLNSHPELKGFFIEKYSKEPTTIGAFKKTKFEIFYHIPGKNHLVFTIQSVVKEINNEVEDAEFITSTLGNLFLNLNKIEDEITTL